jgi:type II secretory pathway component PulM
MKKARKESWGKYVSTVTHRTSSTDMRRKVRRIDGKHISTSITALKERSGGIITDQHLITQALANQVMNSSEDHSLDFRRIKEEEEKMPLDMENLK